SDEGNGAHEWLLEFEREPQSLQGFVAEMDAALQSINSDYEAKRHKDIALRMPEVTAIPKGSFAAWLGSKGKLGGQHKVPRLSNDRNTLDEIKTFVAARQK
ncbi:MAG TPA: GH3 auxin-responsive promoter family protein, partial [Flavisolibacter sp.]|nr:GH3 auxin-responsive promoter family protein [Flavisolibacter sp.]